MYKDNSSGSEQDHQDSTVSSEDINEDPSGITTHWNHSGWLHDFLYSHDKVKKIVEVGSCRVYADSKRALLYWDEYKAAAMTCSKEGINMLLDYMTGTEPQFEESHFEAVFSPPSQARQFSKIDQTIIETGSTIDGRLFFYWDRK